MPVHQTNKPAARRKDSLTKSLAVSANTSTVTVNFETQQRTEHPTYTQQATVFDRARYYSRESTFLRMFLPLKQSVLNYGLRLKAAPVKGKKPDQGAVDKLNLWLDEPTGITIDPVDVKGSDQPVGVELNQTNRELINNFINEVWSEFILLDNAVSFWMDDMQRAATIDPAKCEYSDVLGIPILKYTHGLSAEQILLLPPDQQEAFSKSVLIVNPEQGQHFKVLKRARIGDGFGTPGIFAAFRLLGEVESKDVGMNTMAFALRNVRRLHKLGHEIKGGERAGRNTHFMSPQRATAIQRLWREVVGFDDTCVNFDHEIEYPWPDMKYFDETAWKGSNMRLNQWAGPLGQMLVARGIMPYLSNHLKAQCLEDRQVFALYIETVINLAFSPPTPIKLAWSNMIFNEARLAAEMLKFAQQQGWLSATTGKEESGTDPELEEERKLIEADDPDAKKKFLPIFDAAHGSVPALGETAGAMAKSAQAAQAARGAASGAQSGKPAGTTDKS